LGLEITALLRVFDLRVGSCGLANMLRCGIAIKPKAKMRGGAKFKLLGWVSSGYSAQSSPPIPQQTGPPKWNPLLKTFYTWFSVKQI